MSIAQKSIVILGSGGHAKVVAEAAIASGHQIAGYVAPYALGFDSFLGAYLGDDLQLPRLIEEGFQLALGLGFVDAKGLAIRKQLASEFPKDVFETIIHPSAVISNSASIGCGAFIAAGATIGAVAQIRDFTIINTSAIVDHDCMVDIHSHVSIGAVLAGNVKIGKQCFVGANATIIQSIQIADEVKIGAGAVVLGNIGRNKTVVGNPAREV